MHSNRSFLYGESVFTTGMLQEGRVVFLLDHLERLLKGANFFWGPLSNDELLFLQSRIIKKMESLSSGEGFRVTLSYGNSESERMILRRSFNPLDISIDCQVFNVVENKALKLKTVKVANEQCTFPSFLKCSRRTQETLLYYRSGFISENESLLFCGPNEEVYETSWANIFAIRDNCLFTPPCGGSVLSGIMRSKILQYKNHSFNKISEEYFDLNSLKSSDFVFATNALRGIIPVERIDTTHFNQPVEKMFDFIKVIINEETRSKMP